MKTQVRGRHTTSPGQPYSPGPITITRERKNSSPGEDEFIVGSLSLSFFNPSRLPALPLPYPTSSFSSSSASPLPSPSTLLPLLLKDHHRNVVIHSTCPLTTQHRFLNLLISKFHLNTAPNYRYVPMLKEAARCQ